MNNEHKTKIQLEAVELSKKHKAIALEWGTGSGKTLAAILCMEYWIRKTGKRWFIVCEEVAHIPNWMEEFVKHDKTELLHYVDIFCYASLHKYVHREANLVLDEAHRASDLRLNYLATIDADRIIILSATLEGERAAYIKSAIDYKSFVLSLSDAIATKILPEPRLYKVLINLTDEPSEYVITKGKCEDPHTVVTDFDTYKAYLASLKKTKCYKLIVKCTQKQHYKILSSEIDFWKNLYTNERQEYQKNIWLQKALKRKRFLANIKTPYLHDIVASLGDKKFICFCGSIEQANELGGDRAVHYEVLGNQKIVMDFNKDKINSIYALKMLRSGVNLKGIKAGIIAQLDNQSLSFTQMGGRVFRSEDPELYVLVVKDTQDEAYYNRALIGFDKRYVKEFELT